MRNQAENHSSLPNRSLRRRILAWVGALICLCVAASVVSLYQISDVDRTLDQVNRVSVPLGRLLAQIESDAEVLQREAVRALGTAHWTDPHWRARPLPRWISDLVQSEVRRASELASRQSAAVVEPIERGLTLLLDQSAALYLALERRDLAAASAAYPHWSSALETWMNEVRTGVAEHDREIREAFHRAELRVSRLRTGLQVLLGVVIALSLLMLWVGERALRPLAELTRLAQQIARRGLRKEDKMALPTGGRDEVGALSTEFFRMATALLEREKTVETQKGRLIEQNRLLQEMGKLQERLQRAESLAAIGRLSAQVAHEVRNPLHSIGLEAELALDTAGGPAVKQSLRSILSSVERLEKITDNYLRLSRLSTGQKSRVDLGAVLEEVLATYASSCEAHQIRVDWASAPAQDGGETCWVWGDHDLLVQVLGNLMSNAIQAITEMGEGVERERRIEWRISREGNRVVARVKDSGPGVSEEARAKLFEPFHTTKAQGTGLGLSFVRQGIEEHGGAARLVASDGGACFEISLPVYQPSQDAQENDIETPVAANEFLVTAPPEEGLNGENSLS